MTAYFAGTIDESTLASKPTQNRDEAARVAMMLATCGEVDAEDAGTGLEGFQLAQTTAQIWRGSKKGQKREILDAAS